MKTIIPQVITGFDGQTYKLPHYIGDYLFPACRLTMELKINRAGACGCEPGEACLAERNSRGYWLVSYDIGTHYESTHWLGMN